MEAVNFIYNYDADAFHRFYWWKYGKRFFSFLHKVYNYMKLMSWKWLKSRISKQDKPSSYRNYNQLYHRMQIIFSKFYFPSN